MILVTGGTGRLGGNIVRMLRQARAEVRCLVRIGSEYFWLNDTGASYFFGDLRNPASLKRALAGCEYVIHAAGIRVETTDNNHGVTTLQGSKDLIDAAAAAGVGHFVMTSCMGVAFGEGVPDLEFRAQVEDHLRASGLSHTILRYALFTDELTDIARRAAAGKRAFVWADGGARCTPIWRRDAAIYAIASLDHPAAKDQTLNIGGSEEVNIQEAMVAAYQIAGVDAAPSFVGARNTGIAANLTAKVAGRRWENYILRQRALFGNDSVVDMSELSEAFQIPLTPFADALGAALAEEHPSEDPAARDTRVTHRQFAATVYKPGSIDYRDLPEGPLKMTAD